MIIRTATADGEGAYGTVGPAFCSRPLMTSRHSEWCASQTGVDGTIPLPRLFDLNNLLLAIERLRAQVSCKNRREGEDVSHTFLGRWFRRLRLARLQNRQADVEGTGQHGPASR
jgi:hypothetical protein